MLARFFGSPAWDEVRYWALDLETSGLAARRDRILSVGLVPVERGVILPGEAFYSLVRPPDLAALSAEGIAAHHILPAELEHAPPLEAVLPEIDRRLREGVLLVHFAQLDVAFLKAAYTAAGLRWPRPEIVDTVDLLLKLHERTLRLKPFEPQPPTNLSAARRRLGLPEHRSHHALSDALATAELFLALQARLGAKTLRALH